VSENAHVPFGRPFDKLTVLSKVEGPFDKPFDSLTVDAERGRSIEGDSRKIAENQIVLDPPPRSVGDEEMRHCLKGGGITDCDTAFSGRDSSLDIK
jgi:hypothetical protein